ncbi:MAG: hemerythrin domain-containing protein [Pyrinomonadaceae bacterium]
MNALELLKEDHDRVDQLFQKAEVADSTEEKLKLFEKIKTELEVHTHIEETIFYPRMREEGDQELKDIIAEGIEEHRQAKMFLREIAALTDDSEKVEPKMKVLREDIEHHVMEEEGEMFKMIEEQFDAAVLEELGAEMEKEKKTFARSQGASSGR